MEKKKDYKRAAKEIYLSPRRLIVSLTVQRIKITHSDKNRRLANEFHRFAVPISCIAKPCIDPTCPGIHYKVVTTRAISIYRHC